MWEKKDTQITERLRSIQMKRLFAGMPLSIILSIPFMLSLLSVAIGVNKCFEWASLYVG